jgi:hypothetical protein
VSSYQEQAQAEMWDAIAANGQRSSLDVPRWFYVTAKTPGRDVFVGKVQSTAREVRRAFPACTIRENGEVLVWRGPRDTAQSVARLERKQGPS